MNALFMEHFNVTSSVLEKPSAEPVVVDGEILTPVEAAKEKALAFFKSIEQHIDSNLISITTQVIFLLFLF
jgi:hypothetical protein